MSLQMGTDNPSIEFAPKAKRRYVEYWSEFDGAEFPNLLTVALMPSEGEGIVNQEEYQPAMRCQLPPDQPHFPQDQTKIGDHEHGKAPPCHHVSGKGKYVQRQDIGKLSGVLHLRPSLISGPHFLQPQFQYGWHGSIAGFHCTVYRVQNNGIGLSACKPSCRLPTRISTVFAREIS